MGRHQITIPNDQLLRLNEAGFWQVILVSSASLAALKVSIAWNLIRLSPQAWYKWTLWASIGMPPSPRHQAALLTLRTKTKQHVD